MLKRGDIIVGRARRGAITRARPCVIVQRTVTLPSTRKLTVCPLTSTIDSDTRIRPVVVASAANGLRANSQVEVDWILTESVEHFGAVIGSLDAADLRQIDTALRRWLDL